MKNIFFKVLFKKGTKGEKGDTGISYEVPTGAVMAFDGVTTPEGYEVTSAPSGGGGTIVSKTITANGTYSASSDNADGYDPVVVQVNAGSVNPNYEWWANEDRTLVIRVRRIPNENNNFSNFRIYFNWFDINTVAAPFQELMQPPFLTNNPITALRNSAFYKNNCQVYADCDQTDYGGAADAHGYIGFYDGTIRGWSVGLGYNQLGKYRAIMESTDSGVVENPTPWEEPTFDPING